MLIAFLLAAVAAPPQADVAHLCWIERVEVEGAGVRIRFAAGAPVRAGEESVHGEVGARFTPATSGHDGCTVTVVRKGRRPGVEAVAHVFDYHVMTRPEVRREWIAATP
jgi:hypothetical protein